MSPREVVDLCVKRRIPSISYTYNEPSIFSEFFLDTAKLAKERGIRNILVTNGYQSEELLERCRGLIDAMNIDLKSFSEEFYRDLCDGSLEPVLRNIRNAWGAGIWVEVTTLVIPGRNDSEKELNDIAAFMAGVDPSMPWHISAFHPCFRMMDVPRTPFATLRRAYDIGKMHGIKHVYTGNTPDTDTAATFCATCGKVLIERSGFRSEKHYEGAGVCPQCHTKIAGVFV